MSATSHLSSVKKPFSNKVGLKLHALMKKKDISLQELARQTGITPSNLHRIGNGEGNPTLATLKRLATFFNITIGQLIGDELNLENQVEVPLIGWEDIRSFLKNRNSSEFQNLRKLISDAQISKEAFALTVEEDDWVLFTKGTVLIVDPKSIPGKRDYVVVANDSSVIPTLKLLIVDQEGEKHLKSMNIDKLIPLSKEAKIFGVVRQARKDL